MDKIVIIGASGAGKSTIARKLGSILTINRVVHLDRIFWQRGWKEKPRDERICTLERVAGERQWIIEGTYFSSAEPRLQAADTIIFLDIFPLLCLWRIVLRHWKYRGCPRRDLPEGCTDRLTLFLLLNVLAFPLLKRRKLKEKLHTLPPEKVIWLHSPKEVEDFLAQLAAQANEKKIASQMPSILEGRQLTAARR